MTHRSGMNAGKIERPDPRHSRAAKYKAVAELLEQQIRSGERPAGSRIPPIRTLSRHFGISEPTAFRAVRVIAEKGLVSTTQGSTGTVVADPHLRARPRHPLLACLFRVLRPRNDMDNFALDMVEGIRGEISRGGYRFIYHGLDERDYESRMIEIARSGQVCGLVLDQKTPRSTAERLVETGLPTVMVNRHEAIAGLSTVGLDLESIARETATFCQSRGYERLALYPMQFDDTSWDEAHAAVFSTRSALRREFISAAHAAGFAGERLILIPEVEDRLLAHEPESYQLPRARGGSWQRTAIFAHNDHQALGILAAIRKSDLRLGDDVGVIGCYNLECGREASAPPTTWGVDPHAIGAAAVRELLMRVERPSHPASSTRIRADFVDRGTA